MQSVIIDEKSLLGNPFKKSNFKIIILKLNRRLYLFIPQRSIFPGLVFWRVEIMEGGII